MNLHCIKQANRWKSSVEIVYQLVDQLIPSVLKCQDQVSLMSMPRYFPSISTASINSLLLLLCPRLGTFHPFQQLPWIPSSCYYVHALVLPIHFNSFHEFSQVCNILKVSSCRSAQWWHLLAKAINGYIGEKEEMFFFFLNQTILCTFLVTKRNVYIKI